MPKFGTRFSIQDLHRLTLPYRDTIWSFILAGVCRTAMPTEDADDDVWLSESEAITHQSIAARINQIDWPPTNIGSKTLKFNIVRISVNEILVEETL